MNSYNCSEYMTIQERYRINEKSTLGIIRCWIGSTDLASTMKFVGSMNEVSIHDAISDQQSEHCLEITDTLPLRILK